MALPLQRLPHNFLLRIFQKTQPRILCRLRQTCKMVDDFVEKQRFRIETRKEAEHWFLHIFVDKDEIPKAHYRIWNDNYVDPFLSAALTKGYSKSLEIEDPLKQLSAVRFSVVYFSYNFDFFGPRRRNLRQLQNRIMRKEVVPTLRKMRLRCDWVGIEGLSINRIHDVLNATEYTKLYLGDTSVSEYKNLPTSNCTDVKIWVEEVPDSLFDVIGNVSNIDLSLPSIQNIFEVVHQFIEEIKVVPEKKKNLKMMRLRGVCVAPIPRAVLNNEGVVQLWSGYAHSGAYDTTGGEKNTFYKLQLPKYVVIIDERMATFTFYFLAEDRRDLILECLQEHLFDRIPLDLSLFYKEFMEAETDQEAFKLLYESFPRLKFPPRRR